MKLIEALYSEFHKDLVEWCRYMTGDRARAEDLVQEAFVRALRHQALLETLTGEQRRSWLYRAVKNLYVDEIRRSSRELITEELPERTDPAAKADYRQTPPEMTGLEWEDLINRLPELEGVVFTMRYLQGYNSSEIGRLLDLSPGTVRSKLSEARKHLRGALKENKNV